MSYEIKQIKLDELGAGKVLGFLEAEIMEIIWSLEEATVRLVCEKLAAKKKYSFNTVMTIMNRLIDKKLLAKKNAKAGFIYHAQILKDDFKKAVTKSVVTSLIHDGSMFHIAAFAEVIASQDAESVKLLEDMIHRHSKALGK